MDIKTIFSHFCGLKLCQPTKPSTSYPNNMKLSASMGGMDSDDSYSIGLIFQPTMFNNSISIFVGYQDTKINDTFSLSASYYFDTKVSLFDRFRKY